MGFICFVKSCSDKAEAVERGKNLVQNREQFHDVSMFLL